MSRILQPLDSLRAGAPWAAVIALLLSIASPGLAFTNQECMDCHSDPSLETTREDGKVVRLYIGATEFESSVHGAFACTDCHADIAEIPHPERLAKVDCGICHADAQEEYAGSLHGAAAARGEADAPGCADCHGTHAIASSGNPASSVHPQNVATTCARCHANPEIVQRYDITAKAPVDAYVKSVHGRALLIEGNPEAPTCSSCHPGHSMLPANDPASTVHRMNIPGTCGMCHAEVAEVYNESIHGAAVAIGVSDSPVCTDCHGEHSIQEPSNPASSVFPANIARTTCTRCHASEILASRYGFDATRVSSFMETYHGLASEKGALDVANCASCHGIHNIFPSSDPRSTVNKANLQATCGTCHPNASVEFANIRVHPTISEGHADGEAPRRPRDIAKGIYVALLLIVIGGMAIHNLVIWLHQVAEKRRRELGQARVRRFARFQVAQHVLLLTSFFTLVLTGFALKFPDASWVNLTESLGLSEPVRGLVHRIAAVILIAASLAQAVWLVSTRTGRRDLFALRPTLRDFSDFWHNMRFHMRLTPRRPHFPRFDYTEKAEYLALIWGTIVMIFTGFVLWFPTFFTRFMPAWIFEVSEVVHYYEAWLAFLAIVVWHFFYVIYGPEASPMSLTWMDGMTTVDRAVHHHGQLEEGEEIVYPPALAQEDERGEEKGDA